MLKVHLQDGKTLEVDTEDAEQAEGWMKRFNDPSFQSRITGITVVNRGVQYSLPRPHGFRQSMLSAESFETGKGGQRVFCFADDIRICVSVHNGQRAARIQLTKPGRRKYVPGT